MPLWREGELEPARIATDVTAGVFFLAEYSGKSAGTMKFQLEDSIFWPEMQQPDAAYIHRLAVRRRYAGTGLSAALMRWAAEQTRTLDRKSVV